MLGYILHNYRNQVRTFHYTSNDTSIRKDGDIIHIETDGCIVNIRPGLYRNVQDEEDKISMTPRYEKVTSIEIYPDGRDTSDPKYEWHIIDTDGKTLKQYANVRVVRVHKEVK